MLKPLVLLCALASGAAAAPDPAQLARSVTIYRDTWGVPHIYGPTDASVVFGLMYAQAEDNFWQLEETFIRDLGRAAEVYGPSQVSGELMVRLFESERRAKEEVERAAPTSRALLEAFAAGLNWYFARHPEVKPRLIARFEPWHILALHLAVTLYMEIEKGGDPMTALARGKAALERDWGTWRVPWGEINRLQRIHTSGTLENFSDDRPSLPVPAAPGTVGCLFAYNTRTVPGRKRIYGTSGNTFVSAVEFGKKPRAVSVLVFGQTADPPAWFETGEVKRNAKRTYHP